MLLVDLSALTTAELHRLLAAARGRNEAELVNDLEAELALREGRAAPGLAPPVGNTTSWLAPTLGLAGALLVSAGAIWMLTRPEPTPPAPPPLAPAPLAMTARAESSPPPVAPSLTIAESDARTSETPPSLPTIRGTEPAPPLKSANACYAEPTPADRLVCGYPSLASRHRRLQDAYIRALAAGADADELDADQAQWIASRNPIRDRFELAAAYDARIEALEAAAATTESSAPAP